MSEEEGRSILLRARRRVGVREAQEALSRAVIEPNANCPPVGTCEKASDLYIPGNPTRQTWCDILEQCSDCGSGGL